MTAECHSDDIETGVTSPFVQILDESMCVIREDLTEWLQRFLFSEENALEIHPSHLLMRFHTGLWLARLAFKIHHTMVDFYEKEKKTGSIRSRGEYPSLRGKPISSNKSQRVADFPEPLLILAKSPLTEAELNALPNPETKFRNLRFQSQSTSLSSELDSGWTADSSSSHSGHIPVSQRQIVLDQHSPEHSLSILSSEFVENDDQLVEAFKPSIVAKHWKYRDNISLFLDWCASIGIPSEIRFETNGLSESIYHQLL
ncbi:1,3-beta-glucanosyltransferase [Cichlidogyrus casuarinus]|uniref:1,3-beta-glucanosyltransferase n=1 Tax=Cichlidogyrus casuarinus TaxID=1844966 RepID=A0ABD2QAN3_9PLAT